MSMNRQRMRSLCCSMVVLLAAMAFLFGCGRRGDPVPDNDRETFAFADLSAEMPVEGMLMITGSLTGASHNMEYLVLQLQGVDGELCLGCPFLVQEEQRFLARDIATDAEGRNFSFMYASGYPAAMYRWRLMGTSVYAGFPRVASAIMVVGREEGISDMGSLEASPEGSRELMHLEGNGEEPGMSHMEADIEKSEEVGFEYDVDEHVEGM